MTTTLTSETKTLTMKKPVISGGYTREKIPMSEASSLDKITAYMAENRINAALEAGLYHKMALEAINVEKDESNQNMVFRPQDSKFLTNEHPTAKEEGIPTSQRLDCIYDDEPLGFERDPTISTKRMKAQDPLEEVDLGDGEIKRPAYISAKIDPDLKNEMVCLLKEFEDCFAWDYNEMPGLSRDLVEHRLPIRQDKKA